MNFSIEEEVNLTSHTTTPPDGPTMLTSAESTVLTILAQFLNPSRASLDGLPVHQLK